jgi:hypothetical protein
MPLLRGAVVDTACAAACAQGALAQPHTAGTPHQPSRTHLGAAKAGCGDGRAPHGLVDWTPAGLLLLWGLLVLCAHCRRPDKPLHAV